MTYRISRTTDSGPNADRDCFIAWLAEHTATGDAWLIDAQPEPMNNGGPNDRTLVLWNQVKGGLQMPACFPGLQTSAGANGWNTEAEARAVFNAMLTSTTQLAKTIKEANEKATSAANIAQSMAYDAKAAVGGAADTVSSAAKNTAKGFLAGYTALQIASVVGAGFAGYLVWKYYFASKRKG
jgi:hypothetical protein